MMLYDRVRAILLEAGQHEVWPRVRDVAHLGNGSKAVSLMRDREVPLEPEECEPPDVNGEGGDDPNAEYVGGFLHRDYQGDDLRGQVLEALGLAGDWRES